MILTGRASGSSGNRSPEGEVEFEIAEDFGLRWSSRADDLTRTASPIERSARQLRRGWTAYGVGSTKMVRNRKQRKFQARRYAGLVEDIRQVPLDRLFAQRKLLGNVAVAAALDNAATTSSSRGVSPYVFRCGTIACCIRSCSAETRLTTRFPPIQ